MAKGELVVKKKETNCSEVTLTATTHPARIFRHSLFAQNSSRKRLFDEAIRAGASRTHAPREGTDQGR